MNEHEIEPVRGLPGVLPKGETILWQGAPSWRPLARRAFHVGHVGIYFAILLAWYGATLAITGTPPGDVPVMTALIVVPLALAAMGLLAAIAWLTCRTTVYTITNRRIVLRFGMALPMSINLPFTVIQSAGFDSHADGTGEFALALRADQRISYAVLWPHVRPWRLARAEPMLRAVPQADKVAQILSRALAAASDQAAPATAGDTAKSGQKGNPAAVAA